jgi:hypothetical protein
MEVPGFNVVRQGNGRLRLLFPREPIQMGQYRGWYEKARLSPDLIDAVLKKIESSPLEKRLPLGQDEDMPLPVPIELGED